MSLKPELNPRVQENAPSEDDAPSWKTCTAETPEDVSVDDGKKPVTSEISLSLALETLPACLTVVDKTYLLCTACDVSIKIQDSNKLGRIWWWMHQETSSRIGTKKMLEKAVDPHQRRLPHFSPRDQHHLKENDYLWVLWAARDSMHAALPTRKEGKNLRWTSPFFIMTWSQDRTVGRSLGLQIRTLSLHAHYSRQWKWKELSGAPNVKEQETLRKICVQLVNKVPNCSHFESVPSFDIIVRMMESAVLTKLTYDTLIEMNSSTSVWSWRSKLRRTQKPFFWRASVMKWKRVSMS